jgi:hypothetical protein
MNFGDFDGAAAGAAGGLVRWHQYPTRRETIVRKITAAITSVVCGGGFGYLTQSVVEWKLPDVPHAVAVGLAFVAGLTSGVLAQVAVTLVSEAVTRIKTRVLDRYLPPGPNGPDSARPAAHPGRTDPPGGGGGGRDAGVGGGQPGGELHQG